MTTQILFLCPHNAAKSIYAATTFAAKALDDVSVTTAGTHPDEEVLPIVAQQLASAGHVITDSPKTVTTEALDAADHIINIGCDHGELPTENTITDWQIPNFSDDPAVAFAALDDHVAALLAQLTL